MCLSESQKKQLSGLLAYLFTLLLFEVRDGEVVLRLDLIGERGEEVVVPIAPSPSSSMRISSAFLAATMTVDGRWRAPFINPELQATKSSFV